MPTALTLKPNKKPEVGSFAIAGPISGDWFEMTNNPWKFSVEETRKDLGLKSLHLMNDFEAIALAVRNVEHHRQTGQWVPIWPTPTHVAALRNQLHF